MVSNLACAIPRFAAARTAARVSTKARTTTTRTDIWLGVDSGSDLGMGLGLGHGENYDYAYEYSESDLQPLFLGCRAMRVSPSGCELPPNGLERARVEARVEARVGPG